MKITPSLKLISARVHFASLFIQLIAFGLALLIRFSPLLTENLLQTLPPTVRYSLALLFLGSAVLFVRPRTFQWGILGSVAAFGVLIGLKVGQGPLLTAIGETMATVMFIPMVLMGYPFGPKRL